MKRYWSSKFFALVVALLLAAASGYAQPHTPTDAPSDADSLSQELMELRATVQRLEAALDQNHQGAPAASSMSAGPSSMASMQGGGKMASMSDEDKSGKMSGMGMMGMMKQGMGMGSMQGMPSDPGSGNGQGMAMGDMGMMGGMGMMSGMGGMGSSMATPSALPGFPGASHLYHIGGTGFFLDHDDHITLSTEQRAALSKIREDSLLAQNSANRQVEEAEQSLWQLTSADEPDISKIEAQVREIETLRGEQRLDFIRAVGSAAELLTPEQRLSLLGQNEEPPAADAGQHQHATP